jgi:anaerobic selenocysteine-containing dehydrogenase
MSAPVCVDPSISSTPIASNARDLPTVCVLCSHNCGLRVDVKEGRISDVRPDEHNPITKGYVCNKGYRIGHYVDHAQRVEHPLRRRGDGSFEEISWEVAISEIAEKLGALRETHGPRSIGLVGIGGQANHMDAAYGLSFLGAVGSKRWFNALAQEKTQHFLVDHWLFDAAPSVFFHPDMEHSDFMLVMGTNPRISNRGHNANETFRALSEKEGFEMVVVDPRETETTRGADRHLRITPGTDAYLLLGMAATLVSTEGGVDAAFVKDHTSGFEQLQAALSDVDVEEMGRRCGLGVAEIVETTHAYARADRASILWDLAVEQIPFSTLVSYLIRLLSTLTGNVGREGGNIFMETSTPPTLSERRFDEPERTVAAGIRAIPAMGGYGMISPTLIPEEITVDHPDRMRALICEASNPVLSYSDAGAFREAREQLELLVVIDPAMTETARLADYVLPAACGYEKWEMAGFPNGYPEVYAQLRPPVVAPPGEALPEPEIYARLAEAMGIVKAAPPELEALAANARTPEGAMAWLGGAQAAGPGSAELIFWGYRTVGRHLPSPGLTAVWARCHENALGRRESVVRALGEEEWAERNPFELAAELFRRMLAHPEGMLFAVQDPERNFEEHMGWEDQRVRLAQQEILAELERAKVTPPPRDPEYPMLLSLGLRTRWTANTIQRDPSWRKGRGPHCALHLSRSDAESLGVAGGDAVRVVTRRGAEELPTAIDPKLRDGHCWVPNGFGAAYPNADGELEVQGINLNELSDAADRDPISGCPHHKLTLCRVERL